MSVHSVVVELWEFSGCGIVGVAMMISVAHLLQFGRKCRLTFSWPMRWYQPTRDSKYPLCRLWKCQQPGSRFLIHGNCLIVHLLIAWFTVVRSNWLPCVLSIVGFCSLEFTLISFKKKGRWSLDFLLIMVANFFSNGTCKWLSFDQVCMMTSLMSYQH